MLLMIIFLAGTLPRIINETRTIEYISVVLVN